MALFSAIMAGLGVASSILGAKKQAKAQKGALKANAEIAGLNAETSRENAYDVELAGRFAEIEQYRKINRAVGTTRAAVAGAGIVVDDAGATSQDLVDDMVNMGAMDITRIRRNVALERKKFEKQAENFELQKKHGMASAGSISPNFAAITAGLQSGLAAYQSGAFDDMFGG